MSSPRCCCYPSTLRCAVFVTDHSATFVSRSGKLRRWRCFPNLELRRPDVPFCKLKRKRFAGISMRTTMKSYIINVGKAERSPCYDAADRCFVSLSQSPSSLAYKKNIDRHQKMRPSGTLRLCFRQQSEREQKLFLMICPTCEPSTLL